MIVKQIYTQCLAQASYYIESDGESVVIDPIRDIDSYVNLLDINNSKLKFILETHFHADFISGHLELNKKYGASIIFGHNAEPAYNFLGKKDGEIIEVGKVKIKIIIIKEYLFLILSIKFYRNKFIIYDINNFFICKCVSIHYFTPSTPICIQIDYYFFSIIINFG